MKLYVPEAAKVLASTVFAAKNHIQFYFNGIGFDISPTSFRMYSTNGSILGAFHIKNWLASDAEVTSNFEQYDEKPENWKGISVPLELFKNINPHGGTVVIEFGRPDAGCFSRAVSVTQLPGSRVKKPKEAKKGITYDMAMPDISKIFLAQKEAGHEAENEPGIYSLDHFVRIDKAMKVLGYKKASDYSMTQYGKRFARFMFYPAKNFIGIMTSERSALDAKEPIQIPSWAESWGADCQQ